MSGNEEAFKEFFNKNYPDEKINYTGSNREWYAFDSGSKSRQSEIDKLEMKVVNLELRNDQLAGLVIKKKQCNLKISDIDTVTLPRKLTAENGAKTLLCGEFTHEIEIDEVAFPVTVPWTSIKRIYDKIVDNMEVKNVK